MPEYLRPRVRGAAVMFTVAAMDRGSRVLVEHIAELREAVQATRLERPFDVVAWVMLPDHMHAVWQMPDGDADYSVRWSAIKARFTVAVKAKGWARRAGFSPPSSQVGRDGGLKPALRADKREAGLWQRRFYEHHLRTERDVEEAVEYCRINPVKHGYVERPEEWPWSSFARRRS